MRLALFFYWRCTAEIEIALRTEIRPGRDAVQSVIRLGKPNRGESHFF